MYVQQPSAAPPRLASSCCCADRLQNDSEESIQTIPTIGFNVEVLQYKNIKFQVAAMMAVCLSRDV